MNNINSDVMMEMIIKCADISNAAKPLNMYCVWAGRIMEEFYLQVFFIIFIFILYSY